MKYLFTGWIGSFILFLLFSSCTKESKEIFTDTNYNRLSIEVNFLANHWGKDGNGSFFSLLTDVTSSAPDAKTMKVYVVTDDAELLISDGATRFMDGELSSTSGGSDVTVTYRPDDHTADKPFEQLTIKIGFTH